MTQTINIRDRAREQIYLFATSLATLANGSKDLSDTQLSAYLQEANRKLQDALRMYEFVRGTYNARENDDSTA
jgi:hypothetical protein